MYTLSGFLDPYKTAFNGHLIPALSEGLSSDGYSIALEGVRIWEVHCLYAYRYSTHSLTDGHSTLIPCQQATICLAAAHSQPTGLQDFPP